MSTAAARAAVPGPPALALGGAGLALDPEPVRCALVEYLGHDDDVSVVQRTGYTPRAEWEIGDGGVDFDPENAGTHITAASRDDLLAALRILGLIRT